MGESLDLTSDEAVSDLSSLSDDSSEQKSLEEQIAQAVIARVGGKCIPSNNTRSMFLFTFKILKRTHLIWHWCFYLSMWTNV